MKARRLISKGVLWKVYGRSFKYIINYALSLAHYNAYFHINDDTKK